MQLLIKRVHFVNSSPFWCNNALVRGGIKLSWIPCCWRWKSGIVGDSQELEDVFEEAPEFDNLATDLQFNSKLDSVDGMGSTRSITTTTTSIPTPLCGVPILEELFRQNERDRGTENRFLMRRLTHESVLYRGVLEHKRRARPLSRYLDPSRRGGATRVNRVWVDDLGKLLRSSSFTFSPEKMVDFDLRSKKALRLAIPSRRDEIILDSIRLILDAIFEPRFSHFSYGFRPGRGRQNALREIRNHFRGLDYYIVGELSQCLQHFRGFEMVHTACEALHDSQFEQLLYKALDVGYITTYGLQEETFVSVDRELGINPVLMNIYLDRFDKWMESFKSKYTASYQTADSPLSRNESSIGSRKLRYLRCGSSFFVGLRGTDSDAQSIASKIQEKLCKLKIDSKYLALDVCHAYRHQDTSQRAFFLGYEISRQEIPKHLPSALAFTFQLQTRPILNIPTLRLRECFQENGFIRLSKLKTWAPFGVGNISHWPVEHIVRYFDRLTSGLLEYYALADNFRQLSWFIYLLKRSCNLSIGRKLRLRSMRKVFSKYGHDLEVRDGDMVVASLPDRSLRVRPIVADFFPELTPYLRRRQHIVPGSKSLYSNEKM